MTSVMVRDMGSFTGLTRRRESFTPVPRSCRSGPCCCVAEDIADGGELLSTHDNPDVADFARPCAPRMSSDSPELEHVNALLEGRSRAWRQR